MNQLGSKDLSTYAIVTPARDEEGTIHATLDSVVSQTVPPLQWVIVDDGSTDRTAAIVSEYAGRHPWIRLVKREDHGGYKLGGGVVRAFYEGLEKVDVDAVEFVCKLDADLILEPNHFEQLLSRAAADPKFGIISGITYFMFGGRKIPESAPSHHAIGAARLWRVSCFREIGGLVPAMGWDALDEIRAQMQGWKTRSFPELQITHLRPMSSKKGWYKGRMKDGLTDYLLGSDPLFEVAKCLYRATYPPYLVGGFLIMLGYLRAAVRGEKPITTPEERQFLRKQQLGRLLRLQGPQYHKEHRGVGSVSANETRERNVDEVSLFGLRFLNTDMSGAIDRCEALLRTGKRDLVFTPNTDHIVKLAHEDTFREAYDRATLILADGAPVVWASRLVGKPLRSRVPGSALLPALCGRAAQRGWRLFFLGGLPGVAELAAARLTKRFPDLNVVGNYAPPFGFELDPEECQRIVRMVRATRPDILFVGVGAPKQEKWAAAHLEALDVPLIVCTGAAFDFAAGTVRRAPTWMQKAGLEWLFRLVQEPRRLWRRYLVDSLAFIPIVLSERGGIPDRQEPS